jgi:hypothetical protein
MARLKRRARSNVERARGNLDKIGNVKIAIVGTGKMDEPAPKRTRRRRLGPGALPHLDFWRRSDEFRARMREIGRRRAAEWNAAPRCGARKRTDGEPCGNPGLEPSGRCRFHGGKSPRGKDWHRILPRAGKPDVEADRRKLRNKDRAARARAKRLAAMNDEERAAHKRWHAAHKPGSPEMRAAERDRRKRDRQAQEDFAVQRAEAHNSEVAALERQIENLRRLARERELALAIQNRLGLFG